MVMIPYFTPPTLHLGPLSINPFGLLVAVGILLAARLCGKEAEQRGLSAQVLADFAFWGVLGGVVVGHWVHLFAYHPEELAKGPLQVLWVWDGLSSMGGLLGGIIAAVLFFRRKGLRFGPYGDPLALGVAFGWGVARVGCFAVHDHPGRLTDFPLAVAWPGGARHDLGLYDALVLFACFGLLWVLNRRGLLRDRLLPLLAVIYGTCRFFLDFLRATDLSYVDARYLGLTPAQYAVMALVVYGLVQLVRGARAPAAPPVPVPAEQPRAATGTRG
jgi:phosphatidylglycerol---prolipoprotein diacylglyceryl transferase